jgi:hypothetical protein
MIGWAETRSRINIKVKGSGQECPLHKLTGVPHRAAAGFGSVTMFTRFRFAFLPTGKNTDLRNEEERTQTAD